MFAVIFSKSMIPYLELLKHLCLKKASKSFNNFAFWKWKTRVKLLSKIFSWFWPFLIFIFHNLENNLLQKLGLQHNHQIDNLFIFCRLLLYSRLKKSDSLKVAFLNLFTNDWCFQLYLDKPHSIGLEPIITNSKNQQFSN